MDGELMRFALLALSFLLTAPAYAQQFVDTLTSSVVVGGGGGGGGITINNLVNCSTPADCYEDSTGTVTTQSISYGANTHVYVLAAVSMSTNCNDGDSFAIANGTAGLTWTSVFHACDHANQRRAWILYRGTSGSSGSGTVTIDYDPFGATQESYAWSIVEAVGLNSGTPNDAAGEGFQANGTSNATADLGDPDAGDVVLWACNVESTGVSASLNGEGGAQVEHFEAPTGIRTIVTGYDTTPDATPQPGLTWSGNNSSTCLGVILND
jgi:hypothetical protein